MRHCSIRFVKACLVQLVSHIWIAQFRGLAVASSAEAVWAYKRQARCLEFAGSPPLHCVYTICTHKNIGSICIYFERREMFWQDHKKPVHYDVLQHNLVSRVTSSVLIKSSLAWIHFSILRSSLRAADINQVIAVKSGYFGSSRNCLVFRMIHL